MMMNKPTYPCIPVPEEHKYYYDDCQQAWVYHKLVTELGCGVPWMPQFTNTNTTICDKNLSKNASELYYRTMKSGMLALVVEISMLFLMYSQVSTAMLHHGGGHQ